jgi:hypothetical protein
MAVEIIGTSGNIADVDASGNLKVNIEASSGGTTTVVQPSGANLHVDVDNFPSTQPVSGTVSVNNFPVTQPVSGTLVAEIEGHAGAVLDGTAGTPSIGVLTVQGVGGGTPQPVSGTVSVSNFPATQPVSGTVSVNNFPATQPVSAAALPLPTNAAQETSGNLATIASNTTTIALNTTNETSGAAKTQVTDPTTFTGANVSAKGTQGANALAVQELKDSGRTVVFFSPLQAGIASVTTEALLTFNTVVGVTQTVGVTSYTVPAGKTLRIQYIRCKARFTTPSTTVTFANVQFNFRNAAAIATTNYLFGVQIDCASNAATPDVELPIPDGWELPAGSVIAFSQLGSAATLTLSFDVKGYLY